MDVSTKNDLLQLKIEKWKRDLIDLTNRNVLLNFRPKKNNSLQLFEQPQLLFDELVKNSKNMNIEELKTLYLEQINKIENSLEEDSMKRKLTGELKVQFIKLIAKLRLDARTRLNEQGIQTLYLTFGVLKWKEQGNDKEFMSPLLLVPVELNRSSANQPFRMKMVDDEIVLNPFMAHKLREEKGIIFPELGEQEDVNLQKIWEMISEQVAYLDDWSVSPEVYLSLFSFSKLVMYKDLQNYRELLESHPLIRAISGVPSSDNNDIMDLSSVPDVSNLDQKIPAEESFQVLDADSSQQQAIIAAKNGVSFVLQGPPGTGKSQTISNIIAECLANNKKVLFVSEKMAALEVVKSRLENVGLGDFCLELHSHKANKRSVLNSFQQVLDKHPKNRRIKNELYSNINLLREKLNSYSEKLHQVREPFGKSVYEIHGSLAQLDGVQELLFDFDINESINLESILSLINELERYRNLMILVEHVPIWKGFNQSVYSLELASNMELLLRQLKQNLSDISHSAQIVQQTLGLKSDSIDEIRHNQKIIEMAKYSPKPPRHWFSYNSMQTTILKAKEYQEKMSTFLNEKKVLTQKFNTEILKKDLPIIVDRLFFKSDVLFNIFDSNDPILLIHDRDLLIEVVTRVRNSLQSIAELSLLQEDLGLPQMKKIEDAHLLKIYLNVALKKPRPTIEWFKNLNGVRKSINDAKLLFTDNEKMNNLLQKKYEPSLLELDLFTLKQLIENQGSELLSLFKSDDITEPREDSIFSKKLSIQERIGKMLALQEQIEQPKNFISQSLEIDLINIKSITSLKRMMELISKDPKPTAVWFQVERQHDIYNLIKEYKNVQNKYNQDLSTILEIYEEEVVDDQIFEMFKRFETTYQSPLRLFNGQFNRDRKWLSSKLKQKDKYDFDTIFKHVRLIKRVLENKKWMENNQSDSRTYFGRHYKGIDTEWGHVEDSFNVFIEIQEMFNELKVPLPLKELLIHPTGRMEFFISQYEQLNFIAHDLEEVLLSLIGNFPSLFHKRNIQPIDQWLFNEIFNEMNVTHGKLNTFYGNLSQIMNVRKDGTVANLSLKDLLLDIDLGLSLIKINNQIANKEPHFKEVMGNWYQKELTPWEVVEQALYDVELLQTSTPFIPERYKALLIEDSYVIGESHNNLEHALRNLDCAFGILKEKLPHLFDDFHRTDDNKWNISRLENLFESFHEKLQSWYMEYDLIVKDIKLEYESILDLRNDLNQAIYVQNKQMQLDNELENLKKTFGDYFSGYTTDWDRIFDALAWLEEWMTYFVNHEVPESLMAYISEGAGEDQKKILISYFDNNAALLAHNDKLFLDLNNYFSIEALQSDGRTLQNCTFIDYVSWIDKRAGSISELENWIRFKRLEKKLKEANLSSFLKHIESEKPNEWLFVELFQKRFYRKWLDSIYQEEDILYDFDAGQANEIIQNFREADLKSLVENAERIQSILEKKRQHANESLSFRQELSVLLHEIGKKKRHIAIRKLLSQTSALSLEIKPCFLMSPLSVSQYLDANDIAFDVVIFDEASQIFPEDAIGSIIRASQVIIVGDNKQLPPTDFFKAGGIGEEFEDEDEVDYESILDECKNVLPNMRLRWHYRSRHESLISFSNAAFYSNSLITFPSADHGEHLGVKFVYVPDGLYDRGGTRSNQREAEITAQLVFEHFSKTPNRSLGVIAFSDAQATEIREQIDLMRRKNPSMEEFFKEEQQDEFFVKSLENVQGDERDTIFFSIGYAKAPDGSLYMNFGPLSKNGGERRLNVAVTRAKYQIKLISSLLPQDIPLERTQSVGVHRLREYMEMARSGHLPTYSSSQNKKIFDSPFEEDVYDALVDLGYEVHTQVGVSGYKIDLAVVDPFRPDSYLCGIECDGKTYHSSKVARDRDRLRQQVLENLGWKIHRIWSQEWFKKRNLEITKIKNLLNKLKRDK
ncbi:DUF4011 domain-containing protein [Peribacillus frigoritolerans]|uniref:DUF4011 domain-containing protein n=1 Tax=Peribacillus frigoritolerans TaxID=450367 RepID=UPI001404F9C5|nr:DUF4011 domain-containing protein [Peribacillus frigoritolerans]